MNSGVQDAVFDRLRRATGTERYRRSVVPVDGIEIAVSRA
jgi:hypothetical protein